MAPLWWKNCTKHLLPPVSHEGIDGVFSVDEANDLIAVLKPFLKAEPQPSPAQE